MNQVSAVDGLAASEARSADRGPAFSLSNAIVKLLHERVGRGPRKSKAAISRDQVVVTMRDCLTTVEAALVDAGRAEVVMENRRALLVALRDEASEIVERITGKRVVAYLADQSHDPDISVLAFILDRGDSMRFPEQPVRP